MASIPPGYMKIGFGDDAVVCRREASHYLKQVFISGDGGLEVQYLAQHELLESDPNFPFYFGRDITAKAFSRAQEGGAEWKLSVYIDDCQVPVEVFAREVQTVPNEADVTYSVVYEQPEEDSDDGSDQ